MGAYSSERPLRIGLLGAARIAPAAVTRPAAGRDDVVVTAVAARDPARARAFAEAHGVAEVAAGYAELIARDDVDVVYNGLPIAAHAEWSIRALQAGKAVLCEKAFALNAAEARRMVAAAAQAGPPLIEAFHYRFHRVIERAIEIVRSGELGPLVWASGVFDAPIPYDRNEIRWRADQGGGALGDLGCYPAHALRTLVGAEPEVARAHMRREHGVDAETTAELRFNGEMKAELRCSMLAERPTAEVTLQGERGQLRILNFVAPQLGCRFTVKVDGALRDEPTDGPSTYEAQLDHLVRVMNGEAQRITGGRDAIANMTLMDAIRAAA